MLGTQIHRLIEEQVRIKADLPFGGSPYPDEEELDEPSDPDDILTAAALDAWRSEFGERVPARLPSGELMLELPFTLRLGEVIVRGRIDAVYESEEGLEIVDWKSGRQLEVAEMDQLTVYAGALSLLGVSPGRVTLTYFYLATGETRSRSIDTSEALRMLQEIGV